MPEGQKVDNKYAENKSRLRRDLFLAYLLSTCCPSGFLQAIFCLIVNIRPKPGLSVSDAFVILCIMGFGALDVTKQLIN